MKKRIFFSLIIMIGLFASVPLLYARSIDGWWTARFNILEGDLATGEWQFFQMMGKKASFLFVSLGAPSGPAYLVEFNPDDQTYFLKNTYTFYIRNDIVVLIGPSSTDADGMLTSASTIVFRTFGSASTISSMSGNYTEYDIETEPMVRTGSVNTSRINPKLVPSAVKSLIPAP